MCSSAESQSFSITEQSKITPNGSTYTNTLSIPSEVSNPIIQPTLPFMGPIPGGLKPDMAVLFQGAVPLNAKLFEINFHTGQTYGHCIAFNFTPRITAKYVYMNSFQNTKWEKEECVYDKPFPKGTSFSLLIVIKSEGYEVYVNGLRFYLFQHRRPLEQVTTLGIRGDVFISLCGFIDNWSKSSLCAEQSKIQGLGSSFIKMLPIPSELLNPVINPKIPYNAPISEYTELGMALFIQGTVNPSANQLSIDFKSKSTGDIVFTFNPRFGQFVYMNNCENGYWQKEETVVDKPLARGATFSILIVIISEGFVGYVNGSKHWTFPLRTYLGKIDTLHIWGDACIHYFGFTYNWSRSPFFKDQLKIKGKDISVTSPLPPIPSEITNAVIQPRIPFIGPIPGNQLKPGMALYVQGAVLPNDTQFVIGFQVGQNYLADIDLLFNPRFDQYLYFNAYINKIYQKEELVYDKPFVRGENFILVIVRKQEGYEIIVNGKSHYTYKNRIALEKVSGIAIMGGVSVHYFGFIENWGASKLNSPSSMIVVPSEILNPIIQPKIPYIAPIGVEIKPGIAFYVEGIIPANGNHFCINFQTGPNNGDDVALTFNPRLGQHLYLNSCRNGVWEKEQLANVKPFMRSTAFNILISLSPQGFEMFVNGSRHCIFAHRIPYDRITTIYIWGDISVNVCGFTDNWRRSYTFRDQPKLTDVGSSFTSLLPVPSEISYPVIQPALPYVSTIKGGIKPDMAVIVQGTLHAHAQSFEISFKTGPGYYDDVAYHFNPRIGRYVYMNSYSKRSWEEEECVSDKPFIKGAAFQILIIIKTEGYEVFINGIRHCMFKHRIPLNKVSTFAISGDVSIPIFGFINDWNTLNMSQSNATVMGSLVSSSLSLPGAVINPHIQPGASYVSKIKGGLRKGMALFFQGTIPTNGKSFEINFKTGQSESDDIAFYFNPRIGQYVYLNSFSNGSWEKEECVSDKPFTKGAGFYMFCVINSDYYEVFVNGLRLCTFNHRIPVEKISALGIRGDVSKPIYGFIDNWSSLYLCMDQSRITGMGTTFSSLLADPSDLSHLVIQPTPPYFAKIPGGLRTDMAVYFQGVVPAHAAIFEINFQTGWAPESDIAFHFSPRIGDSVYLNSTKNAAWECNESASITPFKKETSFTMFVVIKPDGYEVYVNGLFHCMFKHRAPLDNICTLSIYGDVSVPFYGFIDNWSKSAFIADQTKITRKESQNLLPLPTEVSQPFIQPVLPYVGSITGGLKPGMALFLKGTIPAHAKGFEINFKTGPSDGDDIAFHFNPVIGEYVKLNSFRNGSWEMNEATPAIPFYEGTALNMFVVIKSDSYDVYVNGVMYCTFKHRITLEKVSTLTIRGDIFLPICGLTDKWQTSSYCSTSAPVSKDVSYQISNPVLPYQTKIQGGLKPDIAILFDGTLPADARRFEINLKTGFSDDDNIAFHFNPRFGQNTYLNSFRKGTWEKEQTAPDKPFTKGAAFKLLLVIKSDGYEVYVNDVWHCVFKHRIPLEEVTTLAILGDVSLLFCGFINNWKNSSFSSLILASSPAPTVKDLSFPFFNYTLPFVGKFTEGIKQDTALTFQAFVPKDAKNFEINLKTGTSDDDNIAFHFKSHIGQDVYMNSFRNGKWETQETAPKNPFEKGILTFKMLLVITVEGYEIYVNDFKLCTFKHRISVEKVSTLAILGDISNLACGCIENWSSSPIYNELKKVTTTAPTTTTTTTTTTSTSTITLQISKAIRDPAIPYMDTIPIAVKQNIAVLFQGIISKNADRFEINFQTGKGAKDDTAFHFNPRLGSYTALNCSRNGRWEKEESASDQPFAKEGAFQIIVGLKSDEYEVYVNGMQHCTFKHRLPLEKVSTISIRGQVSIQMIGFIENWKSPSMSK